MSKESKEKLVEEVENLSEDEEMICLYTELSDRELTYNTMIADLEDEKEKVKNEREKLIKEIKNEKDKLENEKDKLKEEGIKEQSIVIVKTMLKKGYKIDEISEITGLSKEDINELNKRIKIK